MKIFLGLVTPNQYCQPVMNEDLGWFEVIFLARKTQFLTI